MPDTLRILLVEDNIGDAILFRRALKRSNEDIAIQHVKSAEAGWAELASDGSQVAEAFSLAVLDINLPGASGVDLLTRIKRDPALRRLPVLMLSSSADPVEVDTCYASFASGYISKPVTTAGYEQMADCLSKCWLGLFELPTGASIAPHLSPARV